MASPFSVFRKNQRAWMAGAVFIAVVAFVVAPALQSMMGSGRGAVRSRGTSASPVVASWSSGSITYNQMQRELLNLSIANRFLRKLGTEVREKGGVIGVPEVSPDLSFVGITPETNDPDRIVERKIIVAEATRLGIIYDDNSVKEFLRKFVNGKISGANIEKALFEVSGRAMNMFDFYQLMREELAKNEMFRLVGMGMRFEERRDSQTISRPILSTPSKNWQDFQRFNRAAKIRAFPVFVKDFEEKVSGSPSEREMRELYDQGKGRTRIGTPVQSQPAFLSPPAADFEFVAVDLEKLIEQEMKKVPEDVLRAEYERQVKEKQFQVPVTPSKPEATPSEPEASGSENPSAESSTAPAAEPTPNSAPASESASDPSTKEAKPADGAAPSATSDAQPASAEPAPAAEQPVPTATEGTEPAPANPPAQPELSNSLRPRLPASSEVRLVSFQDPAAPAADAPAQPPIAEPNVAPESTPPATALEISPPTADSNAPAINTLPPTVGGGDIAESTPMRTQTFEEVRDTIARQQAMGPAFDALNDRLSELNNMMQTYAVEKRTYDRAVEEGDKKAVAPKRPNLVEIADKEGFEYGRTGLIDIQSALDLPIGRSQVSRGQRMQPFDFRELILAAPDSRESDSLGNLYTPLTSFSYPKRFIFWKIEARQPATPAFELVKDSIREVWVKQRASELAENKAKEIAARVGARPLVEAFESEDEKKLVEEPTQFTWLNAMFANIDGRLQQSNVDRLQPVGSEFMEKVFSASAGDSIVVSDAANSIYYVVQVVAFTPSTEELLERFATSPTVNGVQTASNAEFGRTIEAWYSNLQKQVGLVRN